jgi:hypothetical protein
MSKQLVCSGCSKVIEPKDVPNAIYAAAQEDVTGFGPAGTTREYADGARGWFHRGCFPGPPQYRELPPPHSED